MELTVDLENLPQVTNRVYLPLFLDEHRFLVLKGGAGSGKSVFAAQKMLVRLVTEPGHRLLVLRKVAATLRTSVWALFLDLIAQWGWTAWFAVNKTDMTLTFTPTGACILFGGLDDPEKLKSITNITSVWIEEATELAKLDLQQVNLRLRGRIATYKQILLTFNPISMQHWLRERFWATEDPTARTVTTTYRDNAFLDPEYVAQLEALRMQDPALARIYADGEWGVLEGLVYEPFLMGPWPAPFAPDDTFYGLDFGFNNPTAMVRVDMRDGEAYLTEEIYQTGLTTSDLLDRVRGLDIATRAPLYCDSAEPDRIEELCRAGYNAIPAHKAPGSVQAGIALVRGLRVHSRPQNVNINAENLTYKWGVDRDGNATDQPVKFADHAMDAIRYALHTHLRRTPFETAGGVLKGIGIY